MGTSLNLISRGMWYICKGKDEEVAKQAFAEFGLNLDLMSLLLMAIAILVAFLDVGC